MSQDKKTAVAIAAVTAYLQQEQAMATANAPVSIPAATYQQLYALYQQLSQLFQGQS